MIIAMAALFMLGLQVEGTSKFNFYEKISIITFSTCALSVIVMVVLMMKIDIRPQKTKSEKLRIKTTNYDDFKDTLFKEMINDGYERKEIFKTNKYSIEYAIKNTFGESFIIAILKLGELTEDIYQDYKKNYFEEFGYYLLNTNQIKVTNNFYITYIICVDRVTKIFSEYTESNVKQYWGRFNLPVGVSFGSRTLYIATQKDGLHIGRYKKLAKKFKQYVSNQIEFTEIKEEKQ
jgi:hypothetical protein